MAGAKWAVIVLLCGVTPVVGQDWLMELELHGTKIQGGPVRFNDHRVHLFARDGRLVTFSTHEAKNFRKVSNQFRSFSQSEMRGHLMSEFGNGYEVSGTGHYLVVHPTGQGRKWAPRFEQLYRSFVHYFTARGWRPPKLKFPLVAVVFPTQKEFLRYSARKGGYVNPGVLGYYSPTSNRILLYDVTKGRADEDSWHINAETIIHEAAHQTAFNLGIHNRVCDTPRWIAEGLGTLFEARGVWNSRGYPSRKDRINRERLKGFRSYVKVRRKGSLASFVSSDNAFKSNVNAAYAEAWALTFFLTETRSAQYLKYLETVQAIDAFEAYSVPRRLKHFADAFGSNLAVLESHFLRFMREVE